MNIKQALNQLAEGQSLLRDEMRAVMTEVMTGAATPAQIGALLMALRIRGETIDEIVGAAEVMRGLVTRVQVPQEHLVDLVGTGRGRREFVQRVDRGKLCCRRCGWSGGQAWQSLCIKLQRLFRCAGDSGGAP